MDHNDELLKLLTKNEEETVNLKEFLFKLLHYWHWFVGAALIGLITAFIYNKYTPASFVVNSQLLVKEKKMDGISLDNLFDNFQMKSDVKLDNHIGILSSFTINRQVVENLGWHVFWYRDKLFADENLYGKEPYELTLESGSMNLKDVPVYINPVDSIHFLIRVDSEVVIDGETFQIDFEEQGEYGKKFENYYFSFTLKKFGVPADGNYYFVVNKLDDLALSYMQKVEIGRVSKNADLINLQVVGNNPKKEISFLNELADVYIRYGLKEKNQISENTIHFIERQLLAIVDTLKVTGDHFSSYRADKKVFDLGQKASLVVTKLVELDSKRSLAEMQLEYYENLKNYMNHADKIKEMVFPSVVGITDAGLNNLVVRLSELYSKKEALSYSLHEKNPGIQVIDRELEYTRKSLNENLNNLVFNTRQELEVMKREIDEVNRQLQDYPKTEQDLINIKRMYDLNNELYTFLLQKRAEAEITKASNIPDVNILDPAREATMKRKGPRTLVNLFLGLFLGLIIPLLIIVVRDYFDETIHSREDLKKLTSIPIVADIMHNPFNEKIPVAEHPRSVLAESVRELRTSLDYMNHKSDGNVIGIHSLVPNEGKTFVAVNLAAIMAMNNKKVILIGADMRKPTLHSYLDIEHKRGLSTYLIGNHTIDEIIRKTKIPNLDSIPAGLIPPNPAELLGTEEFGKLIGELKGRYDTIIIDNSPITLVTDAAIVKKHTTINLFVVRQRYSDRNLIDLLNQIVEKNGMPNVGLVINDVDPQVYGSYAYRYGGYYRKAYNSGSGYFEE
ncbi:exopolysaccharide transport family protein [Gaoshiqia sp. Z1-71]|uniref:exopolysaccharide transport family protein n=1 Tax=Gaoshiqia hydrogeniformans TaxID=3290090 RepID=UPI003BF8E113